MSPSGPYRLASSVAVLLASPKLGAVKRTFLLCSKGTLSLCRVRVGTAFACNSDIRTPIILFRSTPHGQRIGIEFHQPPRLPRRDRPYRGVLQSRARRQRPD